MQLASAIETAMDYIVLTVVDHTCMRAWCATLVFDVYTPDDDIASTAVTMESTSVTHDNNGLAIAAG